nr:PASTA domain-containing protein [Actinomycetota bacterium]
GVVDPDDRPDAAALAVMLDSVARQLDAPAPIPITPVLNLDARTPSAADPTEMGVTAAVPSVGAPAATAAVPVVGRKSRRNVGLVVGALALVAAIVMGALYVPILLKPEHDVPALKDDTLEQAGLELQPLKFKLASKEAYSDTIAEGQVISQSPNAGESLREDETVTVTVSKGPPPVPVPALKDLNEEAATAQLKQANLKVGAIERRYSEDIPKGTVIDWSPKDEARKFSEIAIALSNGPAPRTISDWRGKTFDEAKAAFEKVGLKAKRVEGYSDTYAPGQIISTSPGPGQKTERGSTVTVTVSIGSETVAVPNLTGRTVEEATATLQSEGLTVGGVFGPGGKNRRVFFTSPGQGQRVKRGTAVNLYVQ